MVRRFRKRNQEDEEPAISYTRLECPSGFLYPLVWMYWVVDFCLVMLSLWIVDCGLWFSFWISDVVRADLLLVLGKVLGPSSIGRHVGLRVTCQLFQSRISKFNSNSILVTMLNRLARGAVDRI